MQISNRENKLKLRTIVLLLRLTQCDCRELDDPTVEEMPLFLYTYTPKPSLARNSTSHTNAQKDDDTISFKGEIILLFPISLNAMNYMDHFNFHYICFNTK